MASFRNGIKIFGEFSIKQGLGRIRSFSEDRKPGRWLPEDQWAVRQPGSTCPDPCKPKKPPKPSKSWLSLCKDPEPPITCDIRHNNCPPPPAPKEGAWYSLDNLIPKKKPERPPPLYSCREEKKRREAEGEEEVCGKTQKPKLEVKLDEDICCMPKPDPSPAPVVTMSCPLPKELDIMLWCGRPSTDRSRIAMKCQSDRLPYEEFRPQKCWKPLPFSLPCKSDPIPAPSFNRGCIAFSEFKQVEVPKPLYTRYKTVELCDKDFLLCMAEVKCPDEPSCLPAPTPTSCCPPPTFPPPCSSAIPPKRCPSLPPCCRVRPKPKPKKKKQLCPEKRVIEAASCKPVKIKKATKYTFRPKLTKLVEKRVLRNPIACCKSSYPESRTENEEEENNFDQRQCKEDEEPPKVITGTLTKEPQIYERDFCANNPPSWMYVLCKPGCKKTPLIPECERLPNEPDWSSETDGLNFYSNENGNIIPKPPPDPCTCVKVKPKPVVCEPRTEVEIPAAKVKNRVVLMPENYNIKYSRCEDPCAEYDDCESASFDEFIQAKTSSTKKCSKSYPQMKENILYDLQRLCPCPPLDPTKLNAPCRKPVDDPCAPRFFRCYSTVTSSKLTKLTSVQLQRVQARTECGDSSGKCKPRKLLPKKVQCPEEKPKAACAQLALPCCRKAVVPPSCSVRKPMPLCKKKLPPRPSFSECARDPPPCPKMTECNAWEKRMREDSKRKYSDWAFLRNEFDVRQVPQVLEKTGFVKSLESQAREVYANTVKCRTIKPKHSILGTTNDRVVLGLNDDPACDYEQRSILVKQNDNRVTARDDQFVYRENADIQATGPTMPDINLKDEEILVPEENEINESFVTPSDNIEEDKEISKDLMGSIGSWINEFFSVPVKRPVTTPQRAKSSRKPEPEKIDDEYLKSFNVFKEQMKKKLKNETTVHLSTGDKSLDFNFDKLTDKKAKKKSNWSSPLECSQSLDKSKKKAEKISQNSDLPVHKFPIKINDKENIYITIRSEDSSDANQSILIKEKLLKKERSKSGKIEEYFFATPPELSRSLLLNISDQEKCSQLYKNAHARIPEPQPYQLRRTNSYQRNARCYTTNANLIENSKANSLMTGNKKNKRSVFSANDSTSTCTADECLNLKKKVILKRKPFSELPGDESTFDKIRSTKSLNISFSESNKNELKTSSEELVKHLIKKTKVTGRPQPFKKKSKNLAAEHNPKSRFLQSATTSLVVNVLAKKDNNLLTLKTGSRLGPENKILKSDREIKEWSTKHRDIRFEIKKAISPRFNKSSYLSDISDKPETQNDNANFKPFKRVNENSFLSGREMKGQSVKNKKGEEIKYILSKIDGRYDTLKTSLKLKKTEEDNEQTENQEAQNARFHKQHELFKKIPKVAQQTENLEVNEGMEYETEKKSDSCIAAASPAEVIIFNSETKNPEGSEKYELAVLEKSQSLPSLNDGFENPYFPKTEKTDMSNYKNKLVKTKSLQYLKEEDMRTLLSPATELHSEESQNQKQVSKSFERQLSPTEIRPQKTLEPVLLNRSYSTTMLLRNQKPTKLIPFGHQKSVLMFSDEKKDCDKKGVKDKKSDKTDKNISKDSAENCGFQPAKKPGPNCEKADLKP